VPYYLALLIPRRRATGRRLAREHRQFIDAMIANRVVVLGGGFAPNPGGVSAAYLLHTRSRAAALAWVKRDPLIRGGGCRARLVEWRLIAVDPAAVAKRDLVRRNR
jgi:uncharacterized protein YciI